MLCDDILRQVGRHYRDTVTFFNAHREQAICETARPGVAKPVREGDVIDDEIRLVGIFLGMKIKEIPER